MNKIGKPYTLGIWTVKQGNEKSFIAEWTAFSTWTNNNISRAGTAYLLQDRDNPRQFISYGAWESVDAIAAWRERPEFKAFVAKVRDLCEKFEPHSLVQVATSE